MSQDLTEGTIWQQKSKVRYLQRKKDLAVVNKNCSPVSHKIDATLIWVKYISLSRA